MGTAVKLLSAACFLLSTSCNILNYSPPPISCAENKICRVDYIHVLAVNAFHYVSIPFWSVSYLNRTNTSFCLHCKHTPQHRTASGNTHFHFASSIHSVFPKPFSNAIPMVYFISAKYLPR
jgi:hypothetical protein